MVGLIFYAETLSLTLGVNWLPHTKLMVEDISIYSIFSFRKGFVYIYLIISQPTQILDQLDRIDSFLKGKGHVLNL